MRIRHLWNFYGLLTIRETWNRFTNHILYSPLLIPFCNIHPSRIRILAHYRVEQRMLSVIKRRLVFFKLFLQVSAYCFPVLESCEVLNLNCLRISTTNFGSTFTKITSLKFTQIISYELDSSAFGCIQPRMRKNENQSLSHSISPNR